MEIKKLKALLVAVELGSLNKAAEALDYTQSGLTHMMNSLEKEIGFPLLERGYHGVKLTTNAKCIAPAIRNLVKDYDHLNEEIVKVRAKNSDMLHIATFTSIAMHWIPRVVQQYRMTHPNVDIDFRMIDHVESTYQLLKKQGMDLVLVSKQEEDNCQWIHLKSDRYYAVLPKSYDNDGRNTFHLEDFDGKDFLVPSQGFEKDIMRIMKPIEAAPNYHPTNIDDHALINMVEHGMGVSMLTELTLRGRSDRVQIIPVEPSSFRDLGIALRLDEEIPQKVKDFIELTQELVTEIESEFYI